MRLSLLTQPRLKHTADRQHNLSASVFFAEICHICSNHGSSTLAHTCIPSIQESHCEFEASLGCKVSSRLARAAVCDLGQSLSLSGYLCRNALAPSRLSLGISICFSKDHTGNLHTLLKMCCRLCFLFHLLTLNVCKWDLLFLLISKGHCSNLNSEKSILMFVIFSWKSHSS